MIWIIIRIEPRD